MKTHYFTVTDEDGRTAGVIQANNSKDLESLLMDLTIEHHVCDDATLPHSLLINDFIGADKTVTIECAIDNEEPIYYDMRLESVLVYGNKPSQENSFYQVQNKSGNPASTFTNQDAIFLTQNDATAYVSYLVGECDLNEEELKIVKL